MHHRPARIRTWAPPLMRRVLSSLSCGPELFCWPGGVRCPACQSRWQPSPQPNCQKSCQAACWRVRMCASNTEPTKIAPPLWCAGGAVRVPKALEVILRRLFHVLRHRKPDTRACRTIGQLTAFVCSPLWHRWPSSRIGPEPAPAKCSGELRCSPCFHSQSNYLRHRAPRNSVPLCTAARTVSAPRIRLQGKRQRGRMFHCQGGSGRRQLSRSSVFRLICTCPINDLADVSCSSWDRVAPEG